MTTGACSVRVTEAAEHTKDRVIRHSLEQKKEGSVKSLGLAWSPVEKKVGGVEGFDPELRRQSSVEKKNVDAVV
jgi:hypothetical protein